jgi:hypothetical protein
MKKRNRRAILATLAVVLLIPTGCGNVLSKEQKQANQLSTPSTHGQHANRLVSEQQNAQKGISIQSGGDRARTLAADTASVPIVTINGVNYVEANTFAKQLEENTNWDAKGGVFQIGETGSNIAMKVNEVNAFTAEEPVTLGEPPILHNNLVYMPVSAIAPLFRDEISFDVTDREVILHAIGTTVMEPIDGPEEADTGSELDFADDPDDPFKGDEGTDPAEAETLGAALQEMDAKALDELMNQEAVPVLKNIDMNALIRRAKRYLGVKYLFGAGPYPSTGRFDCSTYTDYVFTKFGVALPRTARAQAKLGNRVARTSLRKGDLMFFYVPGRFRTNKTVGHVGIYMGNRYMIHASPEPKNGVQITAINKPYWKKTYLYAKRVAY